MRFSIFFVFARPSFEIALLTQMLENPFTDKSLILVYDGECPVCSAYTKYLSLKRLSGDFLLVNAREQRPEVAFLTQEGYDLDEGMVLIIGKNVHHGASAIHMLSRLTSNGSFFNRLNYWIFRSRLLSAVLYPILKLGRNTLLMILGRQSIRSSRTSEPSDV